jgi:hypothetical protein
MQTFDLPYDYSIMPCTSDKMHTPQHNDKNTECSSSHIQHSGYIYAGFLFAMLLCILCAVYKKKMHVGSGMPTNLNVLTLELLDGFCKNLEQTHNRQNSDFCKFILPTTPSWQTHKSEKLQ